MPRNSLRLNAIRTGRLVPNAAQPTRLVKRDGVWFIEPSFA